MLEKLSSNYILQNILDYIEDVKFKYKLFSLSKLFQKKLDLKLKDYKLHYINQFGLPDMNSYFYNNDYSSYDKNYLTNKLNKDLSNKKIDINKLKATLIDLFQNYFDFKIILISKIKNMIIMKVMKEN